MHRFLHILFGLTIAALLIGAPLAYKIHQDARFRNFHVVKDGVLYRSGQMTLDGLKRVLNDYGIKTIVTLREAHVPGNPPPDLAEETYCKSEGYHYLRIPPRPWQAADGKVPAEIGLDEFRKIMRDPSKYPVLIHCFAGIHRTGAFCAIYRMDFENWSNEQALAELRANGYSKIDENLDILGFLENYQPKGPPPAAPDLHPAVFLP